MAKKRIFGLALSLFITMGIVFFGHTSKNNNSIEAAYADTLVDVDSVSWDNVDYSNGIGQDWVPNKSGNIPQEGYCLLPLYKTNISASYHYDENLLTSNLAGCNVGDYILINGIPSKNVAGAIIYCYPVNGFFIYVPYSSITFSDSYDFLTIEVREGMSIDGAYRTVGTKFEFRGFLGETCKWEINPAPISKTQGEYDSIVWNNTDYSFYATNDWWSGEREANGAPRDGYCVLLGFKQQGKPLTDPTNIIGPDNMTGRGVIGIGYNADYKIKINGVNIIDVPDSKCYIYQNHYIFIYVTDASLSNKDVYEIPTINIEEGLHFSGVVLPKCSFEFRGVLGQPSCWMQIRDKSTLTRFAFSGVAAGWNNVSADAGHNESIFQFGNVTDSLRINGIADSSNLVNRYSDCGKKITINGVSLYEFDDAAVTYTHGKCYFHINLPITCLFPSNGYKVVTLHIEADTEFYDALLGEVTLYLSDGEWVETKPATTSDDEYDHAFSFSSVFNKQEVTLTKENSGVLGDKESSLDTFGLYMNYKIESNDNVFSISLLGNIKVTFNGDEISVSNANVVVETAKISHFVFDDWYMLFIYTRKVNNKVNFYVAVDDIIYILINDIDISNPNSHFAINLVNGVVSFRDASFNVDIKKPILTYSGKSVYGVLVGSEVIDFKNKCLSIDAIDGDLSKMITISWPNEAITNNKMNKGTWTVVMSSSDRSNNTAKVKATVIVTDKLDVTVTFDNKNPTTYRVGDLIAPIVSPTKEGYRFLGWYYNDRLWDFEKDYISCDMNLTSRFQEVVEEHMVTFVVEGIDGLNSYSLFFVHGTRVNVEIFMKDGYTLKAYVNDEETDSFTVSSDMIVRLVYTSLNPPVTPTSSGCGGNIATTTMILSILSGAAFILLVILKKKGGYKHE